MPGTVVERPVAPAGRTQDRGVGRAAAIGVAVAGCLLLGVRPALVEGTNRVPVLVAVFVAIGLVGLAWPLPASADRSASWRPPMSWRAPTIVFAVGVMAFGLGRMLGGGRSPDRFTLGVVAANSLAAVAEEALFRRLVYGLLLPSGPAWAIGGSAALFAIVHVSTYGWWVWPIDMAAGLLFGWQRWASGGWALPAATHVVANVLVVI